MLDTPEIRFSMVRGVRYTFHDRGHKIEFRGTAWTGKETVLVDGDVVSKKRSFSKATEHRFNFSGTNYIIRYRTKSMTGGGWSCSLIRDDRLIRQYEVYFEGGSKHVGWVSIATGLLFAAAFTQYPEYLAYTAPTFVVVLAILNRYRRSIGYAIQGDS